eukprot:426319_1
MGQNCCGISNSKREGNIESLLKKQYSSDHENRDSNTVHCLVAGVVHIERFYAVDRLPTKGETLMGKGVHFGVGGKGANSAVVARKMGAYVDFISGLGSNQTDQILNTMCEYKVNMNTCFYLENQRSSEGYAFLLDDGQQSIIVSAAVNENWPEKFNKKQINAIKAADIILLQREIPDEYNLRIARIANEYGTEIMFDVGGHDRPISKEMYSYITVLSPNETELERLISYENKQYSLDNVKNIISASKELQNKYNKNMNILLKRGANGCIWIDVNGTVIEQNAMKIEKKKIVDTTGAGDAFTASFTVEWIRQRKLKTEKFEAIKTALKIGCIAGGVACQKYGCMPSYGVYDEIVNILKNDPF